MILKNSSVPGRKSSGNPTCIGNGVSSSVGTLVLKDRGLAHINRDSEK
jgi:hypothetical protein